jgi:hypothetical protein
MRLRRRLLSCWGWGIRLGTCAVLVGLVASILTLPPGGNTYAAGTLDQQQTTQTFAALSGSGATFSQSFTAGLTGNLDQVDLAIGSNGVAGTYMIQILPFVAGAPDGTTVLASTTAQSTTALPLFVSPPVAFTSFPLNPRPRLSRATSTSSPSGRSRLA